MLDWQDLHRRRREHQRRHDLAHLLDFGFIELERLEDARPTSRQLANPKDDGAASGVRHRRGVAGEVPLVAVPRPIWLCLEVEVDVFLDLGLD